MIEGTKRASLNGIGRNYIFVSQTRWHDSHYFYLY